MASKPEHIAGRLREWVVAPPPRFALTRTQDFFPPPNNFLILSIRLMQRVYAASPRSEHERLVFGFLLDSISYVQASNLRSLTLPFESRSLVWKRMQCLCSA